MKEIRTIELAKIRPNKNQPRLDFYDESIKNLARSIKESGLVQPLVVREVDGSYELIAGERRLRALKYLGYTKIEAIINNQDDKTSANMALVENLQREDLSAIEEAEAYDNIIKKLGYTQDELANIFNISRSSISKYENGINLALTSYIIEFCKCKIFF